MAHQHISPQSDNDQGINKLQPTMAGLDAKVTFCYFYIYRPKARFF